MPDDHPDKNKPGPPKPKKSDSGIPRLSKQSLQHTAAAVAKIPEKPHDAPPKHSNVPLIQTQPTLAAKSPSRIDMSKDDPIVQNVRPVYPLLGADIPDALSIAATAPDETSLRQSGVTFSPDTKGGGGRGMPPFLIKEATPHATAKSKFRKVAAVLAFTRRHEDMQQISPGIRAVVEDKTKANRQGEVDPSTGVPFVLGPRHQTKSLFSVHSNETQMPDVSSIKTDVLDNSANAAYVVSDPMEKHYLIESTTNRLYSYFLATLAVTALFTSICTYSLQHIPHLFARKIFFHFFWFGMSNIILIVTALLSWSVLGNMFLVCPTRKDWPRRIRKVRWFLLATPIILMHVCHLGWDINLTKLDDEYYPDLIQRMLNNLKSDDNATLLLSQSYFECCGVHSYGDWDRKDSILYHGGYPPTCCSEKVDKNGCAVPIRNVSRDGRLQVWPRGCLHYEKAMVNTIVMIIFVLLTAILISMYIALFYLVTAINIVLEHEITVHLPF